MKALSDWVIVKEAERKGTTESGLHVPDTMKVHTVQGTVVAVGPGRRTDYGETIVTGVKKGDSIAFDQRASNKMELKGEKFLVIGARDIICVI